MLIETHGCTAICLNLVSSPRLGNNISILMEAIFSSSGMESVTEANVRDPAILHRNTVHTSLVLVIGKTKYHYQIPPNFRRAELYCWF